MILIRTNCTYWSAAEMRLPNLNHKEVNTMAEFFLKNDELAVKISSRGAEIRSVLDNETGREYMWQADPAFWGWTSPVLFPIVGNVADDKFRYAGKTYEMKQHGFARRSEFTKCDVEGADLGFALCDSADTLAVYPFKFRLEVGYALSGRTLKVIWKVSNTGDQDMYFQIGAHPAFNTPAQGSGDKKNECYLGFDTNKALDVSIKDLVLGGLTDEIRPYELSDGMLRITDDLFDIDTLIVEQDQAHKLVLLDSGKAPFVTVDFTAPLFGVWSPKPEAPFVCLEPWYGRADKTYFKGELPERDYEQCLAAGQTFEASYTITFS